MVSVLDSASSDPGSSLGWGTVLCSWIKDTHQKCSSCAGGVCLSKYNVWYRIKQ